MIQSFAPGEITPEKALEIGIELCQKFLKEEYQYYLAVHTDKEKLGTAQSLDSQDKAVVTAETEEDSTAETATNQAAAEVSAE